MRLVKMLRLFIEVAVVSLLLDLCSCQLNISQLFDEFPGLEDIVRPERVQSRVIGGEVATIDDLGGYLVALNYNQKFICGGTLIDPRFVISAAHCFVNRPQKPNWMVRGGISNLLETGIQVPIKDYITPAVFTKSNMHMDVAVILLDKPLMGEHITQAVLCNRKLTEGLVLKVSGWGLTDPSFSSPHQNIRTVQVPVINKKFCRRTYKHALSLSRSMFCAGVLGSKDACTFDSGGPIIYDGEKQKELCGIVSFGVGCASPRYPGVYTDINYVKPFIEQQMQTLRKEYP